MRKRDSQWAINSYFNSELRKNLRHWKLKINKIGREYKVRISITQMEEFVWRNIMRDCS